MTHSFVPGDRPLPPKKTGRHRFVAIATYSLTVDEVEAIHDPERQRTVHLDHENFAFMTAGCIDCEMPWSAELKRFCEAPEWKDPQHDNAS